jgi:hypothetical protein
MRFSPCDIQRTEWKVPWKKTCGKTTTEVGTQHQEILLVAVEYKGTEETSRGEGCLETNY